VEGTIRELWDKEFLQLHAMNSALSSRLSCLKYKSDSACEDDGHSEEPMELGNSSEDPAPQEVTPKVREAFDKVWDLLPLALCRQVDQLMMEKVDGNPDQKSTA